MRRQRNGTSPCRDAVDSMPTPEKQVGKHHIRIDSLPPFFSGTYRLLLTLLPILACSPPQPSVVLITIDTLRRDALGVYSNDVRWTPTIDSLAAAGTVWDEARTTFTITQPSHASMLTGLYPQEHGVCTNSSVLKDTRTCLAEELTSAGYDCGAFVNTWVLDEKAGFGQGFSSYRRAEIESLSSPIPSLHEDGGQRSWYSNPQAKRTALLAIEWLKQTRHPYFLWVHFMDPHLDYDPPLEIRRIMDLSTIPSIRGSQDHLQAQSKADSLPSEPEIEQTRRLYAGEVAYVDQALGLLFHRIREQGPTQTVLCVVVSDHGENIYDDGAYVGHAHSLHSSVVRIPLIMSGFGIPRGMRISSLVELVQLKSTLLELLGLVNSSPVRPSLFAGVDRPQLTHDVNGRTAGFWKGWEVVWYPGGPQILEHGTIDSLRAVTRLRSAMEARASIMNRNVQRRIDRQAIEELRALGYLDDTAMPQESRPVQDPPES